MENNTNKAEQLIDLFEEKIENGTENFTDEDRDNVASVISNKEELKEGLKLFKSKADTYKANTENCDIKIKEWQKNKKTWKERHEKFMTVLGKIMTNLNVPGSAIANAGVKLSVSSRTALEVDDEWLIGQYQAIIDSCKASLPEYLTVDVKVDKNKLAAFLKKDASLQTNNPEKVHTKISRSITIK